jgi:hypothetical protein
MSCQEISEIPTVKTRGSSAENPEGTDRYNFDYSDVAVKSRCVPQIDGIARILRNL